MLIGMFCLWPSSDNLPFPLQINIAVQCLSTDFSSQKGVKVSVRHDNLQQWVLTYIFEGIYREVVRVTDYM